MQFFKRFNRNAPDIQQETRENRRYFRVRTMLSALLVVPPTAALQCCLRDLGNNGARVTVDEQVKKDALVTLTVVGKSRGEEVPDRLQLAGRVVWCRKLKGDTEFSVGLEFTDATPGTMKEIADFLHQQKQLDILGDTSQKRKVRRLARRYPMQHRVAGGQSYEGFTRDIDQSGVRFATHQELRIGDEIEVLVDILDGKDRLLIIGDVVRCNPIPDETWFDVVVRSVHVVESDRRRLESLLARATKDLNAS